MKKIILSLSALTITASAPLSLIVCSNKNNKIFEYNSDEKEMQLIAEQYGKVFYLNQEKNYNVDYVLSNYVQSSYIANISTINTNELATKEDWVRFNKISEKYLNVEDNQWTNIKQINKGLTPKVGTDFGALNQFVPMIHQFIQNGDVMGMVLYVLKQVISTQKEFIKNNEFLEYAKVLLTDQNIENLASAFDMNKYKNNTLSEALSLSVMNLSKGLAKLANYPVSESTKDYVVFNNIENSIKKIKNDEDLSLNIFSNFSAVCDILNFGHVFLFYLNAFMKQELEKENVSYLDWNSIETFRKRKVNEFDNEFDLKNLFVYLQKATNNGDADDKDGNMIRNLLNAIFWEKQKFTTITSPTISNVNNFVESLTKSNHRNSFGMGGVIKAIGNGVGSEEIAMGNLIVTSIGLVSTNTNMASGILLKPIIKIMVNLIKSIMPEGNIKNILLALLSSDGFINNPWHSVWSGDILGLITKGKIMNVKELITTSLNQNNLSIKSFIEKLNVNITSDKEEKIFKINFKNVSLMIKELKGVVAILQENPELVINKLGLDESNNNKKVRKDSFFYYLQLIENELTIGSNLLPMITNYLDNKNQKQKELFNQIKQEFESAKNNIIKIEKTGELKQHVSIYDKKVEVIFAKKTNEGKYIISNIKYL